MAESVIYALFTLCLPVFLLAPTGEDITHITSVAFIVCLFAVTSVSLAVA